MCFLAVKEGFSRFKGLDSLTKIQFGCIVALKVSRISKLHTKEVKDEKKTTSMSGSPYNLNDLPSDRRFEELLHRIFEYRIKDDKTNEFDNAILMPGVGEKGVDVLLKKNGKNVGAIQCKMNKSGNLSKPIVAKEIIKFILFFIKDSSLINDINKFQYYFAVTGKYTSPSIKLLSNFKNEILTEANLKKWTESVLSKYAAFKGIKYSSIQKELKKNLSKLNVKPKDYSNINGWLEKYSKVVSEFFDVKKVLDSSGVEGKLEDIKEAINPNKEKKIPKFLEEYYSSAENHLDPIKFIGHNIQGDRPRNITVSNLYVEPCFRLRGSERSKSEPIEKSDKKSQMPSKEDPFNILGENELKFTDVFLKGINKNLIILGDPGAGKSLLVRNLIINLIRDNNYFKVDEGLTYIPFRIELRKYNLEKGRRGANILSYLLSILKNEYQLIDVDEDMLKFIIKNRRTIFFFDGLDEVFDLKDKNTIRDDIVNFSKANKNVKVIITSRFRGYDEISFSVNDFSESEIKDFDQKRIELFVEKFYKTQIKNSIDRRNEIENCNKHLLQVDDKLKCNPLILSLMCLLAVR